MTSAGALEPVPGPPAGSSNPRPHGLTVVCVFNDPAMREQCLDRSLAQGPGERVQYVPVDNTTHRFGTAGAALNHGARQAEFDTVVFVHQDVYLHSVPRLHELAAMLREGTWGMVGAVGITSTGTIVGVMRDRVQLTGVDAHLPVEVDSLDEVMFMLPTDLVVGEPLTEDPDLAWHAYAVEYSLRLRQRGLRTAAANAGLTHNSLSSNLARLTEAHQRVARLYPALVPCRTTCGTVGAPTERLRASRAWRRQARRLRRLLGSARAHRAARPLHPDAVVLSDIRTDVNGLAWPAGSSMIAINLDQSGGFSRYAGQEPTLTRPGLVVQFACILDVSELPALLEDYPGSDVVLVTNLLARDARALARVGGPAPRWPLMGVADEYVWLMAGTAPIETPPTWRGRGAAPVATARAWRRTG